MRLHVLRSAFLQPFHLQFGGCNLSKFDCWLVSCLVGAGRMVQCLVDVLLGLLWSVEFGEGGAGLSKVAGLRMSGEVLELFPGCLPQSPKMVINRVPDPLHLVGSGSGSGSTISYSRIQDPDPDPQIWTAGSKIRIRIHSRKRWFGSELQLNKSNFFWFF